MVLTILAFKCHIKTFTIYSTKTKINIVWILILFSGKAQWNKHSLSIIGHDGYLLWIFRDSCFTHY